MRCVKAPASAVLYDDVWGEIILLRIRRSWLLLDIQDRFTFVLCSHKYQNVNMISSVFSGIL
jgi:hypothetical protein